MSGESGTKRRLRGTRCYLCGAMDRVSDGGVVWRRQATPCLNELGVVVFDPCNKPFEGAVESDQKRQERRTLKLAGDLAGVRETMRPIRRMDLHMVDICDFLVVSIDINVHACGTYEEITLANRQKKPVLCWVQPDMVATPDWLIAMLPPHYFFPTVSGILSYLSHIDSADEVFDPRWYTPIFDMLYNERVLGKLTAGV
jgi:hypothetical protein